MKKIINLAFLSLFISLQVNAQGNTMGGSYGLLVRYSNYTSLALTKLKDPKLASELALDASVAEKAAKFIVKVKLETESLKNSEGFLTSSFQPETGEVKLYEKTWSLFYDEHLTYTLKYFAFLNLLDILGLKNEKATEVIEVLLSNEKNSDKRRLIFSLYKLAGEIMELVTSSEAGAEKAKVALRLVNYQQTVKFLRSSASLLNYAKSANVDWNILDRQFNTLALQSKQLDKLLPEDEKAFQREQFKKEAAQVLSSIEGILRLLVEVKETE